MGRYAVLIFLTVFALGNATGIFTCGGSKDRALIHYAASLITMMAILCYWAAAFG